MIMRTHRGQVNTLPIPLLSLTNQDYDGDDVSVRIFLTNTDPETYSETEFMTGAVRDTNSRAGYEAVTISMAKDRPVERAYGYDVTDVILGDLLAADYCTHFMVTNGDNFYSSSWLGTILPYINDNKELIAWDFLSHHPRDYNVISVKFERKFVDLGSVLFARRAVDRTGARFLPSGILTDDMFARDWWFFKTLKEGAPNSSVSTIHQVLYAHQ